MTKKCFIGWLACFAVSVGLLLVTEQHTVSFLLSLVAGGLLVLFLRSALDTRWQTGLMPVFVARVLYVGLALLDVAILLLSAKTPFLNAAKSFSQVLYFVCLSLIFQLLPFGPGMWFGFCATLSTKEGR